MPSGTDPRGLRREWKVDIDDRGRRSAPEPGERQQPCRHAESEPWVVTSPLAERLELREEAGRAVYGGVKSIRDERDGVQYQRQRLG